MDLVELGAEDVARGWERLQALLGLCDLEVRQGIRHSINEWLHYRGEERQMAAREVRVHTLCERERFEWKER